MTAEKDPGNVTGLYNSVATSLKEQRVSMYKLVFQELTEGIPLTEQVSETMLSRFESICERLRGKC